MEPHDLTVEILKSIRDEVKQTREQLSERIDETNARMGEMRAELSQRIVHSEIRTSTAIAELAGSVREMTQVLKSSAELRPRVERCENEIVDLRARLERVESR